MFKKPSIVALPSLLPINFSETRHMIVKTWISNCLINAISKCFRLFEKIESDPNPKMDVNSEHIDDLGRLNDCLPGFKIISESL
jgi:hypothetical protein